MFTMGKRSSSDPSLSHKRASSSNDTLSNSVRSQGDAGLSSHATSNLHRNMSDESIVFQTVHNNQYSSKMDDDLRVTSPDTPVSSSDESLLSNTVDAPPTDLHDSLDTARPCTVFTVGDDDPQGDSGPVSETTQCTNPHSMTTGTGNTSQVINIPLANGQQQQPIYACESDDISSVDSLEDQQGRTAPTKPSEQTNNVSAQNNQTHHTSSVPISRIAEQLREAELLKEAQEKPKVVGILKKSNSNTSVANPAIDTEPAKTKRVRFADRIDTSTTEVPTTSTTSNSVIDPAHIELWKKVLPNGVTTHYIPNSAFTPKMRVSLTSKPSPSQPVPSQQPPPTNGLTIHIPVPSADSSPSSPQRQPDSAITGKPGSSREALPTQPKVSTASVSLNGVTPTTKDASSEIVQLMGNAPRDDHPKQISLEKTPTDDEITKLWDQIKNALEDNQKVLIPPQVFNFRIESGGQSRHSSETASTGSGTSQTPTVTYDQRGHHPLPQNSRRIMSAERFYSKPNDTSSQKGSMQRQTNLSRPTRHQPNLSPQPAQLLARRGHGHSTTYPVANRQDHLVTANGTQPTMQMTATEPDLAIRTNGRKG